MSYCYEYPRPTVTVDAVVVSIRAGRPEVILIKRKHDPFAGCHALPGGFLEMTEEPGIGAARELEEETGVTGVPLQPLFACGQTGRDPRARCITLVYGSLVPSAGLDPHGADDASEASWMPLLALPPMAFDHARVLEQVIVHLRWQAQTACLGRNFLPAEFAPEELRDLHRRFAGAQSGDEDPVERGKRLGLLVIGSRAGLFRFSPLEVCAYPDYAPMVW